MIVNRAIIDLHKPVLLQAVRLYPTELIYLPDEGSCETLAQAFRWSGRSLLLHPNWISNPTDQTDFQLIWPLMVARPDNLRGAVVFAMRSRLDSRSRALDARVRAQRPTATSAVYYSPPKPVPITLAEIHALCQLVQTTAERQQFTYPLTAEQIAELEAQYLGIAIVESAQHGTYNIV